MRDFQDYVTDPKKVLININLFEFRSEIASKEGLLREYETNKVDLENKVKIDKHETDAYIAQLKEKIKNFSAETITLKEKVSFFLHTIIICILC